MSASQLQFYILGITRRNTRAQLAFSHLSPRMQPNRPYSNLTTGQWPTLGTLHVSIPSRAASCSPFSTSIRSRADTPTNLPLRPTEAHSEALEPRLSLSFTCTALIPEASSSMTTVPSGTSTNSCNHRSTHTFTKKAYQQGVVIIECPSCKNRHLIADNLGWFKNQDGSGGGRTVEDFVRLKGETVRRGKLVQGMNGNFEYVEPE